MTDQARSSAAGELSHAAIMEIMEASSRYFGRISVYGYFFVHAGNGCFLWSHLIGIMPGDAKPNAEQLVAEGRRLAQSLVGSTWQSIHSDMAAAAKTKGLILSFAGNLNGGRIETDLTMLAGELSILSRG